MTIAELKKNMEAVLAHFKEELSKVRTGRSNPAMVENLEVLAYGNQTPLKGLASISTPDPRTILISPWDKSIVKDIEKAIIASPLGLNPAVVGTDIRLTLPDLTAERREELAKVVSTKAEDARVSLRNAREDYLSFVKQSVEDDNASEDDVTRAKKEVQAIIDDMNKQIEELAESKTEQIKTL